MVRNANKTGLFDNKGRRKPINGMRVYNEIPNWYYDLKTPEINFEDILVRSQKYSGVSKTITSQAFESACTTLKETLDPALKGLFNGVHIPFICPQSVAVNDLGTELEKIAIPSVSVSFKSEYPDLHFKAILQGSSTRLSGELSIADNSRYDKFLNAHSKGTVAGWYFPQALQEYDIESQRKQMESLPLQDGLVLSGGIDTAAALIGTPGLLINKDTYPPILCLSALKHEDDKLMLCFKAYGHHLEFWCMSQMLTSEITQVSEQWSGGLTLFAPIIG